MCIQTVCNVATGLTVFHDKHTYDQETKRYFDTGSQELACTAGQCDIVDIA